jgi:hypothetical protein
LFFETAFEMAAGSSNRPDDEVDSAARLQGVEQLDFYLDLARRREERGDPDGSIESLKRGIDASSLQGRLNHSLQFFGRLRRYYLEDARFGDLKREILWYYKWIATAVIQYVEIPLPTVHAFIDQMEAFYVSEGAPLRPVWKMRCVAAMYTGRPEEEEEWFARWDGASRTEADDCEACEWGFRAERLVAQKRDSEALEVAAPITKPRNWCRATPEIASLLMGAAWRCEKPGLARWLCDVSARTVRKRDSLLDSLGHHIAFRGFAGQIERSRRLAIIGLNRAAEVRNDRKKAIFYRQLAFWAAIVAVRTGGKTTLPAKYVDPGSDLKTLPVVDVVGASLRLARAQSEALDSRNGTTLYGDRVDAIERGIRQLFTQAPGE